ncbi:hypothetical protein [Sphingomonas sp. SAFR-052]|uniref:hypothetical protein n=1 Tax=Sphingomonas sp. SAFR-052 TaxID=3436867 RepID=UPI003F7D95AC
MTRLEGRRTRVTGAAQEFGRGTAAMFVLHPASDEGGYATGGPMAVDGRRTMA